MLSRLRTLFSRPGRQAASSRTAAPAALFPPPRPDETVSIVGDVHGCAPQLARLLPRLTGRIILVGDLVDRGEQAAAVIDLLMARPEITCLRGNHEQMLLDFLDDPAGAGPAWLQHGGLQTLLSFGVGGDIARPALPGLRDRFAQALGDARIAWLKALPLSVVTGNVAVTHAGADPARPVALQSRSLLWGHPDCGRRPRGDGCWIAHGHVIVPAPEIAGGVIRIDTGAYAGGPLSAAVIDDGQIRVVDTR